MLSKCCCCVPLRTGSIVLGVLGLLGGVYNLVQSVLVWFWFWFLFWFLFWFWGYIILGILYLIAYGALLFGAIKYNDKAVLVNLVFTAIAIVFAAVLGIILAVNIELVVPLYANNCALIADQLSQSAFTCDQLKAVATGSAAAVVVVSALINGYFWVCNYSFYKELKGGTANPA